MTDVTGRMIVSSQLGLDPSDAEAQLGRKALQDLKTPSTTGVVVR